MTLKEINAAIRAACEAEGREPYPEAVEAYRRKDGAILLIARYFGMHEDVRYRLRHSLSIPWITGDMERKQVEDAERLPDE